MSLRNKALSAISGLGLVGVLACVLIGSTGGVGAYTFIYADGGSYLSNDSTACANCHIMRSHYDAWAKSSHQAVAGCNDCHAPHDSLPAKLWVKGRNGLAHSVAFTTGRFHEPIQITNANRAVTEAACRSCHSQMIHAIAPAASDAGHSDLSCIRCHSEVGHAN